MRMEKSRENAKNVKWICFDRCECVWRSFCDFHLTFIISMTALNWKWPADYNARFDATTEKCSNAKSVDFCHAVTNVTPFEMIRIGSTRLPPMENQRLILPEQFSHTLMRFTKYQSIFVSNSPAMKTVLCEQLRSAVLTLYDRWSSCSTAMMPLIERNQNEPIYRKRKSITVRNLFVPLIYVYLFRWNIYENANKFMAFDQIAPFPVRNTHHVGTARID